MTYWADEIGKLHSQEELDDEYDMSDDEEEEEVAEEKEKEEGEGEEKNKAMVEGVEKETGRVQLPGFLKLVHPISHHPTVPLGQVEQVALEVARHADVHAGRDAALNFFPVVLALVEEPGHNVVLVRRYQQLIDRQTHPFRVVPG